MTPTVSAIIARKIEDVIKNYEPRARLVGVRASPDFDNNSYNVSIEFYVVNAPTELVDMSVMLERLR
jgi:predicted component of type VI protein secretion system